MDNLLAHLLQHRPGLFPADINDPAQLDAKLSNDEPLERDQKVSTLTTNSKVFIAIAPIIRPVARPSAPPPQGEGRCKQRERGLLGSHVRSRLVDPDDTANLAQQAALLRSQSQELMRQATEKSQIVANTTTKADGMLRSLPD